MDRVNSLSFNIFNEYRNKIEASKSERICNFFEMNIRNKPCLYKLGLIVVIAGYILLVVLFYKKNTLGIISTIVVLCLIIFFISSYDKKHINNVRVINEDYKIISGLLRENKITELDSLNNFISESEFYLDDSKKFGKAMNSYLTSSLFVIESYIAISISAIPDTMKKYMITNLLGIIYGIMALSVLFRFLLIFIDVVDIRIGSYYKYKEFVGYLYQIRTDNFTGDTCYDLLRRGVY